MNKLFVIRWTIKKDYVLSVSSFWNESAMIEKIKMNPEWSFETVENNNLHKIVIAF